MCSDVLSCPFCFLLLFILWASRLTLPDYYLRHLISIHRGNRALLHNSAISNSCIFSVNSKPLQITWNFWNQTNHTHSFPFLRRILTYYLQSKADRHHERVTDSLHAQKSCSLLYMCKDSSKIKGYLFCPSLYKIHPLIQNYFIFFNTHF